MIRRYMSVIASMLLLLTGAGGAQQPSAAPRAPDLTPMQRANALLGQMTIEEKAMQLSSVFPLALFDTKGPNHSQLDALLKNGIGHVSALGLMGTRRPRSWRRRSTQVTRDSDRHVARQDGLHRNDRVRLRRRRVSSESPADRRNSRGGRGLRPRGRHGLGTPAVFGYGDVLIKAVKSGKVPESLLDRSVRRVLRDKFALGLFENPYVPDNPTEIRKSRARVSTFPGSSPPHR